MATVYRLMGQEHFRGVMENERGETTADNMSTVMKMVTFRFFSLSFFKQPTVWPAEASKMTKWGSLDTFRRPSCFQIVQETDIPRHLCFIYTRCIKLRIRLRVWKKIFSVIYYVQIICIIIFLLKITKLTFILLNFEFGLRVLQNKVNHGNYVLPNNSVYPIAQSKVNKK